MFFILTHTGECLKCKWQIINILPNFKHMEKTRLFYQIFIIVLSISFISCETEGDDVINPESDRDKFLGVWHVNESCTKDNYDVEIVKDPSDINQVVINNFWHIGYHEKPPYAIVSGNTITIPKQSMCNNNANEVKGNGTLSKDKITWYYEVNDDGAQLDTCYATYEK